MAATPTLQKVEGQDSVLSRIQRNVETTMRRLMPGWLQGSVELLDVALVAGFVDVPHKLGRTPKGWALRSVRAAAPTTVPVERLDVPRSPTILRLNSPGVMTVDILVW